MKELIEENYQLALQILNKVAPNLPVFPTLNRGPKAWNIEKIEFLFEKYGIDSSYFLKEPAPQISIPTIEVKVEEIIENEPKKLSEESLKQLAEISNKRKDLFKLGSFIHANKLDDDTLSADELKKITFEQLDIYDNQIPGLDAKEKFIIENDRLPDSPKQTTNNQTNVDISNELEVYKRTQTLIKNIARDKVKYPARAEKYKIELDYLKGLSNGTN
jgi:hypothetical protein